MDNLPQVHTHPFNNGLRLNRLNAFRLKAARRRRDAVIAAAQERYEAEVDALTGSNDRLVTIALARGEAGNSRFSDRVPSAAVFNPLAHAMEWSVTARCARGVVLNLLARHGIRQRTKELADATKRRIARGIKRYVLDAAEPFDAEIHESPACQGYTKGPFYVRQEAPRG